MFCGLDRPSWVDPRRLPGAFQELWTAEFQENNALLLGKENEALGPFWKSHGNRFCFFADFWRFSTIRSGWHHLWWRLQVDWTWLSYLSCGIQTNPLAPTVLDAEALCRVGHVRPNLQTRESPLCRVGSSTQVDFWIKVSSKPVRSCVTHVGNPNDI